MAENIPATTSASIVLFNVPNATSLQTGYSQIMYTSESIAGDPIVVTGIASVPTADAPDDGWPMITISHGTTGIADECAPSKDPKLSEFSMTARSVGDRFLIAATDYEGLGTPGRHPYLVGESEGRSSIDALLAARQLPDAHGGTRFATAGYSQGGHGSLWASQVAADWAPDLDLVGTFAGAPASEVGLILAAAYPDEADPADFLTPKGVELLDAVDTGCATDTFKAIAGIPVEELIKPDAFSGAWRDLALAQDAGQEKTNDAPVLIIHSTGDGTVPLIFTQALEKRMCANGQAVERRLIDGGGHGAAAVPAYQQALPWIEARFSGDGPLEGDPATAVTNDCAAKADG